jgi:hypothetical protein
LKPIFFFPEKKKNHSISTPIGIQPKTGALCKGSINKKGKIKTETLEAKQAFFKNKN